MDLTEYLAAATPQVETIRIGFDDAEIALHVRRLDRTELDALWRKAATKRVLDPATRQYRTEPDPEQLRVLLVERVLTGWDGVTYGIAAQLASKVHPALDGGPQASDPVPFTRDNALLLLARVVNLETEIWREVTKAVERRATEEAAEKKT